MDTEDQTIASGLPVACTLGPEDGGARLRRWEALSERARPSVQLIGHRLDVRYLPGPGVRQELEALAAAERRCCAFLSWEVGEEGDSMVLRVTANPDSPDDLAPIVALFGG